MARFLIKGMFYCLILSLVLTGCRPNNRNSSEATVSGNESRTEITTNDYANIESDPALSTFKVVAIGFDHTVAIKTDGSLWAWGGNFRGALGDGTTENRRSPVRIGTNSDWAFVSAGISYSVAIKTDGSLWAWGYNSSGQLGDGTTTERYSPVRIGTDYDWASVSAGRMFFTVAIKTDGSMWSWGSNDEASLGNGSSRGYTANPARIGTDYDWKLVSAGWRNSLAIKQDGSLWAWGRILDSANSNESGDRYVIVVRPTQIGSETNWKLVSAGFGHDAAIKTDGTLWSWGSDSTNNGGSDSTIPLQIGTDTDWLSVSARWSSTMAIKADGSLWAWGTLGYYYKEPGGEVNPILDYGSVPVRLWGNTNWAYMSASVWSAAAIRTDGSLWTWGKNEHGQLGDGTTTDRFTPVQVGR